METHTEINQVPENKRSRENDFGNVVSVSLRKTLLAFIL